MGLPIIQEVLDIFRWLIDFFINKTPRPIQILFFLLFLIFLGGLISALLHFTGFHCTSNREVVKTDTFDIFTNLQIWYTLAKGGITGDEISVDTALPDYDSLLRSSNCFLYLYNDTGDWRECEQNDTGCKYYMTLPTCHTCEAIDIGLYFDGADFIPYGEVCLEDAYWSDKTLYEQLICPPECDIPYGYYFDQSEVNFKCDIPSVCGDNVSVTENIAETIDNAINTSDYDKVYSTGNQNDYRRAINIKCSNNLNPRLAFFNIDIFDYKIWLFIIVIYVLFILLNKMKAH